MALTTSYGDGGITTATPQLSLPGVGPSLPYANLQALADMFRKRKEEADREERGRLTSNVLTANRVPQIQRVVINAEGEEGSPQGGETREERYARQMAALRSARGIPTWQRFQSFQPGAYGAYGHAAAGDPRAGFGGYLDPRAMAYAPTQFKDPWAGMDAGQFQAAAELAKVDPSGRKRQKFGTGSEGTEDFE